MALCNGVKVCKHLPLFDHATKKIVTAKSWKQLFQKQIIRSKLLASDKSECVVYNREVGAACGNDPMNALNIINKATHKKLSARTEEQIIDAVLLSSYTSD